MTEISLRQPLLKAIDRLPESAYIPCLWALLTTLDVVKAAALFDYPQQQLYAAILSEMKRLDASPALGTPERP